MLRTTLTLAACSLIIGRSLASGQDSLQALGIWDCVHYAVSGHPEVQAGQWRVMRAGHAVDEDRTFLLPEFSAGARYAVTSYLPEVGFPGMKLTLGGYHDISFELQARQVVYDGGRRTNKRRGDLELRTASLRDLETVRESLALETGTGFLELLGLRRQQQIADNSVRTAQAHHQHLSLLHRTGMATYDQMLEAGLHLDQARIRLSTAVNAVRLARAGLLERMGLPPGSALTFRDTLDGLPPVPPEEASLGHALETRPVLAAYQSQLDALGAFSKTSQGEKKPEISFFAAGYLAKPGVDMFRNEFIEYGRAGVSVNWTFWNWHRADYRFLQAQAGIYELAARKKDLERRVSLDLERASIQEQEAADRLALARSALDAAREHFRLVSNRMDQGQATNTEFLDAEDDATGSALQCSRAEIDLALARWRLAYVGGMLAREIRLRWGDELEKIQE